MFEFNGNRYEIIKNYREGFVFEEVESRFTDYFDQYDYVFGDWAYGKLRLKGFYESDNRNVKAFNDIINLENYITENCAVDCKHFLLKKLLDNKKNNNIQS